MCGIVGILRTGVRPLPPESAVRRMLASIQYRGPDEVGEFCDGEIHMAVARLSIVGIDDGHQPVRGCEGAVTCVLNGEIYNHRELRDRLAERGHPVGGRCDALILPHLYEEDGDDFVTRLTGMFACAIWDARRRRLLLARDRLGIKPLYWAQTADYLLFASEIKALFASGLVRPEIDRRSLDDLFSLSYPCPPRTMFRDVFELRPAHVASAGPGERIGRMRRYWRAAFAPAGMHRTVRRRDAEVELRELMLAKIESHLSAEVPVATYLSGGLDSSAIAALVKEVTGEPPHTFSIGFTSREHDESEFAATMARALGAANHAVICDASTAEHYPKVLWHMELPLQFPLALPLSRLSAAAREKGFPVVLTGEGADELMGGYDCFRAEKMRRWLDRPGLRALRAPFYRELYRWLGSPEGLVEHFLAIQRRPAREVKSAFGGVYPPWYSVWTAMGFERARLLSPDGREVRPIEVAPEGFSELLPPDLKDLHPLDAGIALELETRLPSWILTIGDRASMSNAVEARPPLLDHEVVDFLAGLHPSLKIRGFTEKAVLRDAMRGALPESIRRRGKRPFYTPIKSWFFDAPRPEYVEALLGERALRDAGLFEPSVVSEMQSLLSRAAPHHLLRLQLEWMLVLVLGTQLLHRMFVVDFDPAMFEPGAAGSPWEIAR